MPRKVSIPFAFGRNARVDPKLAPFGTLRTAKNLRVDRDGRLRSRTGYQPLVMSEGSGSVVAYDLFEFGSGRLCALGSQQGEGFPVDVYEYTGVPASTPWRAASQAQDGVLRPSLTPFTAPRQVCGVPQPARGVQSVDVAAGGGYVAIVYTPTGSGADSAWLQVVRESDDQVILAVELTFVGATRARVCFAAGLFFIAAIAGANLNLIRYDPSNDNLSSLVTIDSATATVFDIEAVSNPTNSVVVVIYGQQSGGNANANIKRYNASGVQQGTTLSYSAVVAAGNYFLAVEADEADNTINSTLAVTGGGTIAQLRSHNFANALLDGPTAIAAGGHTGLCRLPARTGWVDHVGIVSTNSSQDTVTVEYREIDTHTLTDSQVIGNAVNRTTAISASAAGQPSGIVFGGYVTGEGALLPLDTGDELGVFTGTSIEQSTNCLWYVSTSMIHMATRDLRASAQGARLFQTMLGISLDASTGRLAWNSLYLAGIGIESPTVTTLALNAAARRQTAMVGGQLYLAGGPVQIYDGRLLSEAQFNEVPSILSLAGDTDGNLAVNATYSYVLVFEYALPDGSFIQGPPSLVATITTGGTQDEVNVTIAGPHSQRIALAGAARGAEVTAVLYRTIWNATNASQGSTFHEVSRSRCPATLDDYGDNIVISDTLSDANAAVRAILYVQGGPVENNAPEMATYLSASSARLDVAGLARRSEFQESKEQALDQAINFSGLSAFFTRCSDPIEGIVSLDGIRLILARSDVYTVSGEGPQDDAAGSLPPPVALGSPSGLRDWKSLLVAPDGVWAQLDDAKLYRFPRGGGSPEWLGIEVQDTLAAFPEISGAARVRADDTIVFACSNAALTSARILARSLRTGIWLEDEPPLQTSRGIEALASYGDLVAYVSGGVVYQQHPTSYADGAGSVITTEWQTEPIYPFGLGGNGWIHDAQVTGEFRSAGTLAMRASYDDGVSFEAHDSFVLSGTAGDTFKRKWALKRSDIQNVVVELIFTPSSAGEGIIINQLTLLVDDAPGLEDLDPGDCGG